MAEQKPQVTLGAGATQPPPGNLLLDQYKTFVGDLAAIGTRYTTAQSFYWTIVSVLIGILALKDVKTTADYLKPTFVLVALFIVVICLVWSCTSHHYRKLFGAKLEILKQLEDKGLYTLYRTEGEILRAGSDKVPSLLAIEIWIPLVLMAAALLFVVYAAPRMG